jgi:flagellar protein FliS
VYTLSRIAANAYANVGLETGVVAASPHQLIVMLFEGAQLAVKMAAKHMADDNIPAKSQAISRAINIISSGLQSSLDVKNGGEMAERLNALYDYMCRRLLLANLRNQNDILEEVSRLLEELHQAWKQIGNFPPQRNPNSNHQDTITIAA